MKSNKLAAFTQPNALLAPIGADATSALQLQDNNQNNIMVTHICFNLFKCTTNVLQIEKNLVQFVELFYFLQHAGTS